MSIEIEALLAERRKRYANFVLPETSPLSYTHSPSLSYTHTMHTLWLSLKHNHIHQTYHQTLSPSYSLLHDDILFVSSTLIHALFFLSHSHAQRRTLTQDPFLIVCLNMEKMRVKNASVKKLNRFNERERILWLFNPSK